MQHKESYLDNQLCFLLYVSSKEIIKKYTTYLKEHDLTYTAYIVIMAIEDKEKLNIKTLGNRIYLDSGTLTPLLKKLEKKGIVTRIRETNDERNLQISLTEQGVTLKPELASISKNVFCDAGVSKEEAQKLIKIMHQFVVDNF